VVCSQLIGSINQWFIEYCSVRCWNKQAESEEKQTESEEKRLLTFIVS